MHEPITLTREQLARLLAQAQQTSVEAHERRRRREEAEYRHLEAMARALEWGEYTIPEPELRELMARGLHHNLCRRWGPGYGDCTCGIAALRERDREAADEADALAGYGLV